MSWFKRHDHRQSEATLAREKAERELERTKAETPMYRALAQSLVEVQRENHLGARIADVFRGRE